MERHKEIELDNLQTLKISETVCYQYRTKNGKNYSEGLTALGRFYPCVKVDKRFYFGIHRNGRFVPGIIWNQRFILGIVTNRGFFPGIATDHGFQPGIIAFGAFIPGVVVGNNFVLGLVRENHFTPGCYTSQGNFALGRIFRRRFENGVIDSRTRNFVSTGYEAIPTKAASNLVREEYGISKIRRYEEIGGIPIAGTIKGAISEDLGVCSSGIITNKWIISGGLSYSIQSDGISFDKKYLPHADKLSEIFDVLGIDTSGLSDEGWSSTQDEWEGLAYGLTDGKPGNPFGSGMDDFQDLLLDGLNSLGKGSSELINDLNRGYGEYWANVIAGIQSSAGMARGDAGAGGAGHDDAVDHESTAGDKAIYLGLSIEGHILAEAVAGPLGALGLLLLESILHGSGEGPVEGAEGAGGGGSGGGPSAPDGDDGEVSEGNVIVGGAKGLRPIEVKDPNKKGSGIKVVQTDTGVIMVVDYDQLRDAMKTGPAEGMNIGFNPLTGETINVIPGAADPKARFGQLLKQWYLNPIVNPRT